MQAGAGCYAFVLWFDVTFPQPGDGSAATVLSTSPHKPVTHWAQTILTLRYVPGDPIIAESSRAAVKHLQRCHLLLPSIRVKVAWAV